MIGAVVGYAIARPGVVYGNPYYAPPVVYTPPCQYVRQQAFDQYRRPLFDQHGQPVTYTAQVCPAPVMRY
ncbi:MAG: hypothetical protein Q8Q10_02545 [bacterium]|nr:hypothetical protein [bacterium]